MSVFESIRPPPGQNGTKAENVPSRFVDVLHDTPRLRN
jgi:hypothetical protein